MTTLLMAVGVAFAAVNGANDGGAMVGTALKVPGMRPATAVVTLAVALIVVPVTLGTRVASTLVSGIVPASEQAGLLLGLSAAVSVLVVGVLARAGLPSSLTLALVGGLVGVGLGLGLEVDWGTVAGVAAAGVAAPLVGGLVGFGLTRVPLWLALTGPARLRFWHMVAFPVQAVAYAANDGQKMLAVVAAASVGGAAAGTGVSPAQLVALAAAFAVGALVGLGPTSATLESRVLRATPSMEVSAELASSAAVLGAAGVGAPVSMTQAISGALVGAGMTRGRRRIRWQAAGRLAAAWVLTLPVSGGVGALAALTTRAVT